MHKPISATSKSEGVDESLATLDEVMHKYIKTQSEIKEAGFPLEQFKASADKNISASAGIMLGAYELFDASLKGGAANIEHILNNPKVVMEEHGTTKREFYQTENNFEESWSHLGKAAAVVALSLEDQNRLVDGKTHYLKITSSERQKLKELLIKDFGPSVKDVSKATQDMFPASLLWEFLGNDKWENADDK